MTTYAIRALNWILFHHPLIFYWAQILYNKVIINEGWWDWSVMVSAFGLSLDLTHLFEVEDWMQEFGGTIKHSSAFAGFPSIQMLVRGCCSFKLAYTWGSWMLTSLSSLWGQLWPGGWDPWTRSFWSSGSSRISNVWLYPTIYMSSSSWDVRDHHQVTWIYHGI